MSMKQLMQWKLLAKHVTFIYGGNEAGKGITVNGKKYSQGKEKEKEKKGGEKNKMRRKYPLVYNLFFLQKFKIN